ncbi:hypothetical protein JCM10213v2_003442 [Rhodosporidiobolus nylandii]
MGASTLRLSRQLRLSPPVEELQGSMTVLATRRLVLIGLGNYTHPLTRHSIGQLLLKNLALRASSDPRFRSSGSPTLSLTKAGGGSKHSAWTTLITLHDPPRPPLELLFVLPKALMNISGPAAVAACAGFLPPIARERTPPPIPLSPPCAPPAAPSAEGGDSAIAAPPARQQQTRRKPPPPPPKPMYRLLTLCDDLDLAPSKVKYQRGGGPRGHNGVRSLSSALSGSRDFHRLWIGIGRPEERSQVAGYVLRPMPREEVHACEFDEASGRGGEVLERAWEEVLRIAYEED